MVYNLFSAAGGRDLLTPLLHFSSAFKDGTSLPIRHAELVAVVVIGGFTYKGTLFPSVGRGVAHQLFCKLFPKARTMDVIAAFKRLH